MLQIEANLLDAAAERLGCEPEAAGAVMDVESNGNGFLDDGRCTILFEAHIFSRLTNKRYDDTHPAISSKKWNRKLYVGGAGEYERLDAAAALDVDAARKSASWGAFQIMGFNHEKAGYDNIRAFVMAMQSHVGAHVGAFTSFVLAHKPMVAALKKKDWAAFAKAYNGPGYAKNKYDEKMEAAYERRCKEAWRAIQQTMTDMGRPLVTDGIFGPRSLEAYKMLTGKKTKPATPMAARAALAKV